MRFDLAIVTFLTKAGGDVGLVYGWKAPTMSAWIKRSAAKPSTDSRPLFASSMPPAVFTSTCASAESIRLPLQPASTRWRVRRFSGASII